MFCPAYTPPGKTNLHLIPPCAAELYEVFQQDEAASAGAAFLFCMQIALGKKTGLPDHFRSLRRRRFSSASERPLALALGLPRRIRMDCR